MNGTLLDPGEQEPALTDAIRLSMAHSLAGDPRPLAELLEAAGGSPPERMTAYPDVVPGLEALASAGHRLAVATNSERGDAARLLERASLLGRFETVLGVEDLGAPKPARSAYRAALERLDAGAQDAWLVAAHQWDLIGAHGAGLRTAFVDRGRPAPRTIPVDRRASGIDELRI